MRRLAVLILALLLASCTPSIVRKVDPGMAEAQTAEHALVFGRMNYVIDGQIKTPYSAFRPAWQAPFFNALQLESGELFAFPAVENADGSFAWEIPPGSYYLGHLVLEGTSYSETYTRSTGTTGRSEGVRYSFKVLDEVGAPRKSLMFHRPDMPIGDALVEEWRKSRSELISRIFG